MNADRSSPAQRAIDFLSSLDPREVDVSSLPASADYGAIARLARRNGVDTDETALRQAFATIMRARLIASSRSPAVDQAAPAALDLEGRHLPSDLPRT